MMVKNILNETQKTINYIAPCVSFEHSVHSVRMNIIEYYTALFKQKTYGTLCLELKVYASFFRQESLKCHSVGRLRGTSSVPVVKEHNCTIFCCHYIWPHTLPWLILFVSFDCEEGTDMDPSSGKVNVMYFPDLLALRDIYTAGEQYCSWTGAALLTSPDFYL